MCVHVYVVNMCMLCSMLSVCMCVKGGMRCGGGGGGTEWCVMHCSIT